MDIPYASNILNNTNIYVGAQNMYSKEEGPYTGEISVKMLKSIKTNYVLLGHYERKLYFNETEEEINKKLQVLKKAIENEDDNDAREALRSVVPTFRRPEEINKQVA